MKKYLFALLFAITTYATEKPYFTYIDAHAMSGCPMMGMGFRAHKNVHGFDASGNILFLSPLFHLRGLYLLYPAKKGAYLGAGLGFLNEPESMKRSSFSFEAAVGWEGKIGQHGRVFFELDGIVPFGEIDVKNMSRFWPGLTIGLGF